MDRAEQKLFMSIDRLDQERYKTYTNRNNNNSDIRRIY